MNAVIYARYSSSNQTEASIEGQMRECNEYAKNNGINIVGTYIDRARSATTDNRPDFKKMIKDSSNKKFDAVIVWKLDRFARNRYDSAKYKTTLKKNGVKVISITEHISDDPNGIILESMLEGMAEYYSKELSVKVIRGMTENALKCKFNGGVIPLGYTVDKENRFAIDPLTAPIVREVFQKYADGKTIVGIIDELNSKGIHNNHGGKITINIITRMLHNRKYIGEYQYRDIVQPNGMPSIVSVDLFEKVQDRMAQTKKAPAKHKAEEDYLLSPKLYCGDCNRLMLGESGTSKTSKKYHYYKCAGVKRFHDCNKKTVKKDWLKHLQKYGVKRLDHKRKLINIFVNSVYLYDDKIIINFNYKDGSKAVRTDEVKFFISSSDLFSPAGPRTREYRHQAVLSFLYKRNSNAERATRYNCLKKLYVV